LGFFALCCASLFASPVFAQGLTPSSVAGGTCPLTGEAVATTDSNGNTLTTTGNNLICDGSHWQYPAVITGSLSAGGTAISCASGTAGAIEWTGSAFQGCNGTSWTSMGGGVTGTGTTNYVARWTSSTALGTGVLYDNGTNVGVGTATPHAMIHDTGGLIIGPDAATCTSANNGEIRYTSGNTSPYNWCNGSAWVPFDACPAVMPTGTASAPGTSNGSLNGIWGDGTYIYSINSSGTSNSYIYAHTWNGTTWTMVSNDTTALADPSENIYGDGTYLYVAENSGSSTGVLAAYTFNGTAFTLKGSYTTTLNPQQVWSIGAPATNIFLADSTNGVKAFTFSGTAFTLKGTYKPTSMNAGAVWGDGTYVYVYDSGNDNIDALTFSGTTWTLKGSITADQGNAGNGGLIGDGTYIYFLDNNVGLRAYSFNGTTFTQVGSINIEAYQGINGGTYSSEIFVKNGNIYVNGQLGAILVFSFNGTTFTYKGLLPSNWNESGFWVDNSYLYTRGSVWIEAMPACH
jgi:hypothetical protein